ncbi:MAG: helicase-related protein, partial [Verrucomicrobiae bacterium]|nr:helicase-related protein [Verrucomicrobiae bacterium]
PYDERLIRQAIERELARGGQVYFVHNRVQSIEAVARRLEELLNGEGSHHHRRVRIAIGHGQMSEHELERVMHRFVHGEVDVLVCTTIIESGLDIPNANTIIIDRADRFGLSDLYQLRGRVGRYKHQAYAYILLPRHMALVQAARKRISAIRQYSSLGSGFKIAMRDLEIRGAGNILGPEQSGHIAAIGFDLYCQLLQDSIAALKGEPRKRPPPVTLKLDFLQVPDHQEELWVASRIPSDYIADGAQRIQAYRRIASCADLDAVNAVRRELRDRYGPLPDEVELLLGCMEIKLLAGRAGIDTVESRDGKIILTQRGQLYQRDGRFPRFRGKAPLQRVVEIKRLLATIVKRNE